MAKWEQAIERKFEITTRSGEEWTGWCQHERHKKPTVSINTRLGVWFCQACGWKGTLKNEARPDVEVDDLLEKIRGLRATPLPAAVMTEASIAPFDVEHEYWSEVRGFSEQTIEMFDLGYDFMEDQLTIPVRAHTGELVGVIRRVLDGSTPKYMHPQGLRTSRLLYGAHLIEDHKKVALVEGPLDAVACWDARVPACALFGSRISEAHREILLLKGVEHVVIMTDNDAAGDVAVDLIHDMLKGDVQISVMQFRSYWNAKDPGELTPQQRRKGFHSAIPWHRLME